MRFIAPGARTRFSSLAGVIRTARCSRLLLVLDQVEAQLQIDGVSELASTNGW